MDIIKTVSNFVDFLYTKKYLFYIVLILCFFVLVAFLKSCNQDSVGVIFNDTIIDNNLTLNNQSFNQSYVITNETFNQSYAINNLTKNYTR